MKTVEVKVPKKEEYINQMVENYPHLVHSGDPKEIKKLLLEAFEAGYLAGLHWKP